jgi:hypothetical protein
MSDLPPLPEPDLEDHPYEGWGQNMSGNFYSSERMRTYAQQVRRTAREEALEEAAALCDQLWTRAGDADQCADAIRSLK